MLLTLYSYLAIILFLGISLYKACRFSQMPLHGRLELYPVPKEVDKGKYGGSYFEELEWWRKPRHVQHGAEIKEMLKEMLFIKRLFTNQQNLWWFSYAFHLGIYFLAGWTVLLVILAATSLSGITVAGASGLVAAIRFLTGFAGFIGFVLATFGSCALLIRRLVDSSLYRYTSPQEYFNLFLIFVVLCTGMFAWGVDYAFVRPRMVMEQILSFQPLALRGVTMVHLLLLGIMFIYIPLSKMSHYVGKYFTYHKVLWENEPNIAGSKLARAVERATDYRPQTSWSAPHIQTNRIEIEKDKIK